MQMYIACNVPHPLQDVWKQQEMVAPQPFRKLVSYPQVLELLLAKGLKARRRLQRQQWRACEEDAVGCQVMHPRVC